MSEGQHEGSGTRPGGGAGVAQRSGVALARACPVCGRRTSQEYRLKCELRLVRCSQCTMVYVDPVSVAFASGSYYQEAGTDYYLTPAKLESDYSPVRFERELRLFRRHCSSGRVLDVGCSSGAFLFQLTKRFQGAYQVLGTDVSGPPLDYAESRGVPVLRGDFLTHEFGQSRFGAVTFWAVLEHLVEPGAFLRKAWTILEPGGLCFTLVPNLRSLAVRVLGTRYRYIYPQHLNYFTRTTLERLTQERFEILDARSTHFNPIVIWQDWRRGGGEVPNAQRAALLQRTTAYKQDPWLRPLKGLYRLGERVLGAFDLADNLVFVLRRKV